MKLIFAQGNPGAQYNGTRHNIGFFVLDSLANKANASWKIESKYNAEIATLQIAGEKVLLAKPRTFYNETGRSARALVDFYKLDPATDVLVLHDELALPFGTLRIRQRGSDAGNNGIKSLNAHLGPDYWRIRVGIWNELRDKMDDAAFVLSKFHADERTVLETLPDKLIPLIDTFIHGQIEPSSQSIA